MLAATRLIALHKNKGMTVAACLKNRTDYIENPDKTEQGQFVSSYACSTLTADEEFMLTKRQYDLVNGRRQKNDVIAYQIRQSFKPGEITAEEANKVGYELAMRFTKGKHAFVVATHTDRQHIHNHVIFNSTALDGTKKFRDFFFSALAVQRLSDLICLEHQLSVIEKKPYRERQKRIVYPPKESNRDRLCEIIDTILARQPEDYEAFLQKLEQQGYEVKRGKHTAVKGKGQKRFIRFQTLGTGYSEEEIKAVLEGKAKHQPYQRMLPKEQPFQLLVDIQGKMAEGKSVGYKKWATKFNLKEMSKTLLFLQEQKISSADELRERAAAATERYHAMGDSIKAAETRLAEIAVLKTHIINYAKTRSIYEAYRKAGYSKRFLEANRESIALHKAAKAAFDEAGLKKLPKVKELSMDNTKLLFPVLLLCDENGEYINFTEDEIVSALEEANDSDVRYFKPTEEEQSYFHRIYARLISEVQDRHDKTVAPTIAYNKKKIENWANVQQEQLHVQLTDAQKEVEEYILAEMAATDTLEKKDIRKKAAEAKKKMDKLQNDLPKRRKEIQDEAQAEIDRFNQSQEINPLLLINIVLKF